jgi:hypothetical protein
MIAPPRLPLLAAEGWEFRWQLTALEPVEVPPGLQDAPLDNAPRSNIVISRTAGVSRSAEEAAENFLEQTKIAIPNLAHKTAPPVTFPDHVVGVSLEITFPATQEIALWQRHVFRVDGVAVTQLVATCDDRLLPDEKEELAARLTQFVPDPDTDPVS